MKKIFNLTILIVFILLCSCENEPILPANINTDSIEKDSELFLLMERIAADDEETALECINFNYSFILFIFDEQNEFIQIQSIASDYEFSQLLGNLQDNYSISLNYPIIGTLNNGDIIEITTNAELKEAIDACVRLEQQGQCNQALVTCQWRVRELTDFPNDYEGDYLTVSDNGVLQFHTANEIYFGTWVSFFIGNDLHLNISLVADGEIADQWNYDWKVITLTNHRIEVETGDKRIRIEQDCAIDCALNVFEVCELGDTPGFASFELQEYSLCSAIPVGHDTVSALSLSYFETELDAQDDTDEISATEYTNTSNPQTIFVRVEDLNTGDFVGTTSFEIAAIECDGD